MHAFNNMYASATVLCLPDTALRRQRLSGHALYQPNLSVFAQTAAQ
jgi:hypothetical protein